MSPTLSDLGISKDQSSAYQELAHPDVAEGVILEAVADERRGRDARSGGQFAPCSRLLGQVH